MPLAAKSSLDLKIVNLPPGQLKPAERNARRHTKTQINQIAASIAQFGFNSPVLLDDEGRLIAGHGRVAAAKQLLMTSVPTITLSHMSPAERRAYALADNRLAEIAGWDEEILATELIDLEALDLDFDVRLTGFDGVVLDRLLDRPRAAGEGDVPAPQKEVVSRTGDVWLLDKHRLVCGDARDRLAYEALLQGETARMLFADPPWNLAIDGHVGRRVRKRGNFIMGSGEMSPKAFTAFLAESLGAAADCCVDGAIAFVCMDWRHMRHLHVATDKVFAEQKNLICWAKENAGLGQFYRSQHELIAVFKKGEAPHTNTFGLGAGGRYRTNVWSYPGVTSFGERRQDELEMHPTVKPLALVADAIRDVSRRDEIVLDPFGGSGTTLIAAEKTRRRARVMELDPRFVDVSCRRWAAISHTQPVLEATGEDFQAVAEQRAHEGG